MALTIKEIENAKPKAKKYKMLDGGGLSLLVFPSPVRLGPRTVAWVRSEIKQWAAERVLTSRSTTLNPGRKRMPQPALREAWASSKKWA